MGLEEIFQGTTNKFTDCVFENKVAIILEARYIKAGIKTELKKVDEKSMSLTTFN